MPSRVRSFAGLADRVVVHLPVDVLAGGNALADVGAVRIDAASRHPRQQLVGARQRGDVGAARRARAAIGRGLTARHHEAAVDNLRAFRDVDDEHAGVVHDGAVARTKLQRFGEAVLGPRHRRVVHLHAELAFRGNRDFDRHLEHVIGLAADGPAFGELRHRREIGLAALRRAAVHPRDDRVDLLSAEAAVVPHLQAVLGIGAPRRHFPRAHFLANHLGPGPHVLVREERHRRDFAGPVTHRALVEDDGCDVFGKGGDGAGRRRSGGGVHGGDDGQAPEHGGNDTLHEVLRRVV